MTCKSYQVKQFLIDDITSLMNHDKAPDWLYKVNDDGLYALWKDLVNLSTMEAIE